MTRKYLQPDVSFLGTRVRYANEHDLYNLRHMLVYFKSTIYISIILREDSLCIIKWWLDALILFYCKCCGYIRAIMLIEKLSVCSINRGKNLN